DNTLLIDFDAYQSIVEQANGSYSLKPVLRVVDVQVTGTISGSISILGVNTTITAISSTGEEFTTITNEEGSFQLS
ncbi:MAG: carbohydrate-binding protein, partial [Flavobacterium haoranii]